MIVSFWQFLFLFNIFAAGYFSCRFFVAWDRKDRTTMVISVLVVILETAMAAGVQAYHRILQ